ncbi:MAG: OadG family protein [Bacteroidales bacterium]|jgi:Na+-transporting methylmalonyl-CoA/oxaloacetate decarboxylase gamma subunit|nr:OadG family protein [Bacteroidales bacterium]
MNKFFIAVIGACLMISGVSLSAQHAATDEAKPSANGTEFYDPLTPQSFAFDKDNKLFVAISSISNAIDLIYYSDDSLSVMKHIVVDVVEGRHDVAMIYRPKGIAIYENHIVYLAVNRDSTRFTVLNLQGDIVRTFTFDGCAQAFSYSPAAQELYIAGDNSAVGYDIMVLDVSNGFDNISASSAATHFRVKKKAEELFKRDPSGMVLLITSMITVFTALILLYIVFKVLGTYMIKRQNRKAHKTAPHAVPRVSKQVENTPGGISGDVYAAIAAAIYMHQSELHDEETTIITIENVSRKYTPWSSKLYGLNTYFNNR